MNRVEQCDSLLRLVGLQRADQVQLDLLVARRIFFLERRPFGLGLLHAIFAEHAMPDLDHRLDGIGGKGLRHRNERDLGDVAIGVATGARDVGRDSGEPRGGVGRGDGVRHGLMGAGFRPGNQAFRRYPEVRALARLEGRRPPSGLSSFEARRHKRVHARLRRAMRGSHLRMTIVD